MPTRDNNINELKIYGNIDSVENCDGPMVSKLKGIDRQCCATCYNMRNCFYRNSAFLSKDSFIFDYINKLDFISDLKTCYAISNCGTERTIAFKQAKTELSYCSYSKVLLKQFIVLHEMGIVIEDIRENNFSCTNFGIPVVFPRNNYSIKTSYGNENSGVKIKQEDGKKYFKIISKTDFFNSGKLAFIYNAYMSIIILSGKKPESFAFYKDEYYEIPEGLNFELKYKTEKPQEKKEKIPGTINDKYVVLDLDNTLISSDNITSPDDFSKEDNVFYAKLIERKLIYKIKIRKFVRKFLNELVDNGYKLLVWSAGREKYVKDITSVVFKNIPLTYVFTQEHTCDNYYKKLSMIGDYIENFNINNCVLIDDNESHQKNQETNFMLAEYYEGDDNDNFLENYSEVVKKKLG